MVIYSSKKVIDVKWIFKVKLSPNGEITKYKERLLAKEFLQKHGIDFNEVYAPISKLDKIILVVVIATYKLRKMHQLDVKLDFLNGLLEDEVNVKQPPGFEVKGQERNVYKVRKTLYGLKKIPRA